ncbi:hypothetical protein CEV32_2411 [Brucella rhizosphaerae]|uniref:Uncharacterized protein n=1 Tax=Brucella rhizosphaerae TaxID=571254 RepID=A0A256F559_9HYPH|nr:hypothetical protein CEV32_2411 [Brucella rhizosphaerae]
MDIAQYVRVLCTLMCNNLCHAPGADNENVLLHFLSMLPLPAVTRHLFLVPRCSQPRNRLNLCYPHHP